MSNSRRAFLSLAALSAGAVIANGCFGPWRRHERREERHESYDDHRDQEEREESKERQD